LKGRSKGGKHRAKIRQILASNLDPAEKLRLIVEEMRLVDKENIREAVMMLTPEEREELDRRARNGEEVVPGGAGGKSLEAQINRAEGRRRICPLEPRNPKLPISRDLGASSSSPSSSSCWLSWVFNNERAICLCSLILRQPVDDSSRAGAGFQKVGAKVGSMQACSGRSRLRIWILQRSSGGYWKRCDLSTKRMSVWQCLCSHPKRERSLTEELVMERSSYLEGLGARLWKPKSSLLKVR